MIWQKYFRTIKRATLLTYRFSSERFLKTKERTKKEIDEVTKINTPDDFVNTGSNIDNTKIVSVGQKSLSKIFHLRDCNKEVTPDHEDLVDCLCGLMVAKESCIVNDKVVFTVKSHQSLKVLKIERYTERIQ